MKNRQPLFHVVKREHAGPGQQVLAYVAAVALALAVGAVLLKVQGVEPLTFYRQMLTMGIPGSRYPWRAVENFIRLFVPLLITSMALALAFKMRFWNIGGEGQFIMGAFWAGFAAMKLGDSLPQPAMVLVMALCGALGGGLYGVFVAALKVRFGTNETLLTLMLNYVALYFLQFFAETKTDWNFFLDPASARPKFAKFPESAQMMTVPAGPLNLNLSLVAAIAICVILYIYLNYTKRGYEIAVVGDSPNTARYAGMKVGRIVIRTIFLSASPTNDVGWTGIVVAWLAKLNTAGIVAASLLITVLQFGCQAASATYPSIDANFANLLQGVILFIVLAADFFTRFRLVRTRKEGAK